MVTSLNTVIGRNLLNADLILAGYVNSATSDALSKSSNSQSPPPSDSTHLDGTPVITAPSPKSLNRSFYLLGTTILNLFLRVGEHYILFVTTTFLTPVTSVAYAHKRLNSLLNKVRQRYGNFIWVLQPHTSGAIHYHLLIPVTFDCHNDTNLQAWSIRNMHTDAERLHAMNPELRAESDWWTATAKAYGFGRVEVAPVYSNQEAVSKYLQRKEWLTRHWPFDERKNIRFWSCSTGLRSGTTKFSWNSPGGRINRDKLMEFAATLNCFTYEELQSQGGPRWGWDYMQWRNLND